MALLLMSQNWRSLTSQEPEKRFGAKAKKRLSITCSGLFESSARLPSPLSVKCVLAIPGGEGWSFGAEDYAKIKGTSLLTDDTTVFGELVRIGGATAKRCSVRLPNRAKLLYCKVNDAELSRRLGKHLYQEVVLTGKCLVFAKTWDILAMHVYSAAFPKNRARSQSFATRCGRSGERDGILKTSRRNWRAFGDSNPRTHCRHR